jgi:hypothetical protein
MAAPAVAAAAGPTEEEELLAQLARGLPLPELGQRLGLQLQVRP